jgi:hypothetical protein
MADEQTHIGATFLAGMFGSSTTNPVFVCSLLNAEAKGSEPINERFVATRNLADISGFARKWDRPGRGLYFCVSTLAPNSQKRCKATVGELNCLFVDIDFKDTEQTPEEVRKIIGNLMCPPAVVNSSGHGLHLFWPFKEALEAAPENILEVERLLGLLATHLGGDPAAAEVSRLLRLPGTHNTKHGNWLEVVTEVERPLRYELDDLREWLELVSERPPLVTRRPEAGGNGRDANPWLELARRQGYKPPARRHAASRERRGSHPPDTARRLSQHDRARAGLQATGRRAGGLGLGRGHRRDIWAREPLQRQCLDPGRRRE